MGKPDVLLARTVSRGAIASICSNRVCLASRFSEIDSTTKSASRTASSTSIAVLMRPTTVAAVSPSSWSWRSRSPAYRRMLAMALSNVSCRRLINTVSTLPRASTREIWLPIRPPPMTADLFRNRSCPMFPLLAFAQLVHIPSLTDRNLLFSGAAAKVGV